MNFGGIALDKVRRSMRLLAEEVIPRFRLKAGVSAAISASE